MSRFQSLVELVVLVCITQCPISIALSPNELSVSVPAKVRRLNDSPVMPKRVIRPGRAPCAVVRISPSSVERPFSGSIALCVRSLNSTDIVAIWFRKRSRDQRTRGRYTISRGLHAKYLFCHATAAILADPSLPWMKRSSLSLGIPQKHVRPS